jgi:hypothetical protein
MMTITKYGAERVQQEGFDELVSTFLARGEIEGAKLFIAVALAGNAMGELDGTLADFQNFMDAADADIVSCFRSSAARCYESVYVLRTPMWRSCWTPR